MKEKIKSIALQTLSILITIALCLGSWGVGFFLSHDGIINVDRPLWIAVCVICAVVVVALAATNVVGAKALTKKLSAMKMREIYNMGETLKSDVESNYKRAEKGVRLTLALAYIYVIAVMLIMLCCCFGMGVLLQGEEVTSYAILIIILIVFVTWGLTDIFYTPLDESAPPAAYLLDKSAFPLFYATAREAADKSGCRLEIKIYGYGSGASVTVYRRTAIICLNSLYGALLTRDELFTVMLHEFAHVINKDVNRRKIFARAEQRFDDDGRNVITTFGKMLLLPLPSVAVILKTETYGIFASRYHEIEADKALKELGDPQMSINALAKTRMVGFFESVPHRELEYDFFAPEKPTGDYAAQELALFLKHRDLYGEEWRLLLEKELPARVDSHPTFRNRMTALGCENYDACRLETDPAFIAEQQAIIAAADRVMNEMNEGNYDGMRQESYLNRKKVIDEYFETVKDGKDVPDNRLYQYIEAFFGIDDDIALELAEKATTLSDPTIANYYKANILFNRNDDGCIECLKAIASSTDDMELALSATDRLGEYALKTGNAELLTEYRNSAPEAVQASRDKGEKTRFDKSTEIEKCDLPDEVMRNITDGLDKKIIGSATAIHIGVYKDAYGAKHYPVSVTLKMCKNAEMYETYNGLCQYFFGYRGNYDFIVLPPASPLSRKVRKSGLEVYNCKITSK